MRKNSSSLLLIELIFSILFLSLAGGTTLLVFAKARVLSDNTVGKPRRRIHRRSADGSRKNFLQQRLEGNG